MKIPLPFNLLLRSGWFVRLSKVYKLGTGLFRQEYCGVSLSFSLFFFIAIFLGLSSNAFADGSKNLYPNGATGDRASLYSTNAAGANAISFPFKTRGTHYVYAKAGEYITAGTSAISYGNAAIVFTSPNGTKVLSTITEGRIRNRTQEKNGPRSPLATGTNTDFFTPYSYQVRDGEEGIWRVDLDSPNSTAGGGSPQAAGFRANDEWTQEANREFIVAWDISIYSTPSNGFLPGRVYASILNLGLNGGFAAANSYFGTNYVLTKDGRAYYVRNNGNNGFGFAFFSNNKGFVDAAGNSTFKSLNTRDIDGLVQDPRIQDNATKNLVTHKLFYTNPAADLPVGANVTLSDGIASSRGTVTSTWLKNEAIVPTINDVDFTGSEGTPNQASQKGGYISFNANVAGSYRITIPISGGTERILTGSALAGLNRVIWDGRDGAGQLIPAKALNPTVKVRLTSAEVHFPFVDMEINPNGIIIELTENNTSYSINRSSIDESVYSDRVYWNDVDVGKVNGTMPIPVINTEIGQSSRTNGHKWGDYGDNAGFGDNRSLDTWAYILSNEASVPLNVTIKVADLKIESIVSNVASVPVGGNVSFTVKIKNDGPSGIVGSRFNFAVPAGFTINNIVFTSSCATESGATNTGVQFQSLLTLPNLCEVTYTITGTVAEALRGKQIPVTASILRPNDVTDPNATNVTFDKVPLSADVECTEGTSGSVANCNNIKTNSQAAVEAPSIRLEKTGVFTDNNNKVNYTFKISNIGDVTLNNLSITDVKLPSAFSFAPGEVLLPGDSRTYTSLYTLTQDEKDAGLVSNTATATGLSPGGEKVSDISGTTQDSNAPTEIIIPEMPALALDKTGVINPDGTTITYTFKISNTGNVTLHDLTFTDLKIKGPYSAPLPTTLAAGTDVTLIATYSISLAEKDAGIVSNTATVAGVSPKGTSKSASDTEVVTIPELPSVTLDKTGVLSEDGNTITYTFKITNTGNVTLNGITLVDAKITGEYTPAVPLSIPAGTNASVTATYLVSLAEKDAGVVNNTATVTGVSPKGTSKSATDTEVVTIPELPSVTLDKTGVLSADGNTITYTFKITNTGNVTLNNVLLSDPKITTAYSTLVPPTMAAGTNTSVTATYLVSLAEKDAGVVNNTATVTGVSPKGTSKNATDTEVVTISELPSITLDKTGVLSPDGNTITYTFKITNTGNVTLHGITLVDAKITGEYTPALPLAIPAGTNTSVTATYLVSLAEKDAGVVNNTATVAGVSPIGTSRVATDSEVVTIPELPSITLDKTGVLSADGNTITYTFKITNTGNVTLHGINLVDPKITGEYIPTVPPTLAAGTSISVTGTYLVSIMEKDAGIVNNTATVTGVSPAGTSKDATDTEVVTIPELPSVTLDKTGVLSADGNTITYTFKITNTGNVTLHGISLVDAKITGGYTPALPLTIPAGTSTSVTATFLVSLAEKDAGVVNNTATVTGVSPKGTSKDATDTEVVTIPELPSVTLDKTGVLSADGNTITYTFKITNTGNVTLNNVLLSDPKITTAYSPLVPPTMAAGTNTSVTATYLVSLAEKDAGVVNNTATVTGVSPKGTSKDATDTEVVTIPELPSVTLDKTGVLSEDGNTITYTFKITNTGNVTLNNVLLSDPKITTAYSPLVPPTMAAGTNTSVTATYLVSLAEKDAGVVNNTATVTGVSPKGTSKNATDTEVVTISELPSITLDKTGVLSPDGNTITYTFKITNTGNVTLHGITLVDAKITGEYTPALPLTIPAGTNTSVTATYLVSLAEKDAGVVNNTATVAGVSPIGTSKVATDSEVVTIPELPSITLDKTGVLSADGNTITYTFKITNTGNVTLHGINLVDPKITGEYIPTVPPTLAAGTSISVTGTYLVSLMEKDAGIVNNTATVTGVSPAGTSKDATDTEVVIIPELPSVTLDKTGVLSADGNTITYTFKITNTGNVTLHGISLVDAKITGGYTPALPLTIPAGTSTSVTATYLVSLAEKDAGVVNNTATVTGVSPKGTSKGATDTEVVTIPELPSVTLDKTGVLSADGNTITYTFKITNTGNVTLHGISLVDAKITGGYTPALPLSIPAGTNTSVTATYLLSLAEKDAGVVNNTATVTGLSPRGTSKDATDSEVVTIPELPSITLDKTGVLSADGNTITYTFKITNTGNVTLHGINLVDPKITGEYTPAVPPTLAAGTSISLTGTYLVSLMEKDAGIVNNTATVTGVSPAGTSKDATDTEVVTIPELPSVTLDKTGVLSADGNTITYTFKITNTGNVTLHGISLVDAKITGGYTPVVPLTLAAGRSTTVTATYLVSLAEKDGGVVNNTATVTGLSPAGTSKDATDNEVVTVPELPSIALDKTGVLSADGNTITYTFNITNTGNVTLHGVSLVDAKITGGYTPALPLTIPAGTHTSVTATYLVSLAEKDAGLVNNTATVTGLSPRGTSKNATDSEVVTVPELPSIALDKTGVLSADGNTITYTFNITNTGNVTLHGISLIDPKITGGYTPALPLTIPAGTNTSVTATYLVSLAEKDGGVVNNTATVTGISPRGTSKDATDSEVVTVPELPLIALDKTGVLSADGNTITYTFNITNTGNVTLHGISLIDPKITSGYTPALPLTIAAGTNMSVTATYLVSLAEKDAGVVNNTATVTGLSPRGTSKNATDSEVVTVPELPSIALDKTGVLSADGNTITYTFNITNTGNVTLHGISLVDAKITGGYTPALPLTIPAGTNTSVTATYLVSLADKDGGVVNNTATVTGISPRGTSKDATDSEVVTVPELPSIALDKTGVLSSDGNTIIYTFEIRNTGNVTLKNILLNDPKITTAYSPLVPSTMAAGTVFTVTGTYNIKQTEKDEGIVDNSATVTGISPLGTSKNATDLERVNVPESPAIKLVKKGVLSPDGNTITYTFTITNTGDVTLNKLTLTDNKLPAFTIDATDALAPGDSEVLTATYAVQQADKDAGIFVNEAVAKGTSPRNLTVQDKSGTAQENDLPTETLIPESPKVTLVKKGILSADHNTVTYTFEVTNTGDVTLNKLTLEDGMLSAIIIDPTFKLAPGTTKIFSKTYTLKQAEKDAGKIENIAIVRGTSPAGRVVEDKSGTNQENDLPTVTILPESPAIKLVKKGILSVDKNTVLYTFEITNTGDVTLKNLVLTDVKLPGALTIPAIETLAPGITKTVTATYTINQIEKDAQRVINTAEVKAMSPANAPVTDISGTQQSNDDNTIVMVPESPAINLVKKGLISADRTKITYTFNITNTGNVTLKGINLTDLKLPGVFTIDPTETLAPGAEKILTAVYTIRQDEINAGKVTNTATVTGLSPANIKVSDDSGTEQDNDKDTEVIVPQTASVAFTKIAAGTVPSSLGSLLTYEIKVTNTGTVTLYNLVVTDANAIITAGSPIAALAPGASMIITATHKLTQADIDGGRVVNQATVKGSDPNGSQVEKSSDDPSTPANGDATITPITRSGDIALVKTGVVNSSSTGVVFTFSVTNTGNVTLTNIVLDDPMLGGTISLNNTTLAPGQSTSVSKPYMLTLSDRNAGKITNTATVRGVTPQGGTVTDVSGTELLNDNPTTVIVVPEPAINLVKTGELTRDFSTITYFFVVTNTGNVTLTDLNLIDVKITGRIILNKTILEPGDIATGSVTYTVTDQEKRDGLVINTATVTGKSPAGNDVTAVSGTKDNNNDPTTHIIDDAPQAINDNTSTIINQPVTFIITENDLPSFNGLDKGSIVITQFPENGQVIVHPDGTVTYTPNRGYSGPDGFMYTITDLKGKISNKALVNITVIPIDLFIPNTFTPNGDGKNDTFKIIGRESYDTIEFLVFNRWGNEVYRNKNYLDEWDGSGLSEGTYYYILTLKKGANQVSKKGWILLKR
jgi:gliding motility-associated-like protein/uncharacterized repeat protein (TIGR01451 family)